MQFSKQAAIVTALLLLLSACVMLLPVGVQLLPACFLLCLWACCFCLLVPVAATAVAAAAAAACSERRSLVAHAGLGYSWCLSLDFSVVPPSRTSPPPPC